MRINEIIVYCIFFIGFVIMPILSIIFYKDLMIPKKNKFLTCIFTEKCDNKYTSNIFWTSTHLIFYFIIGLLIPNKWPFIIMTIIIWEILELILSIKMPWYYESYYKKIYDILAGILGYYLGTLLILNFCNHA